MPTAPQQKSAQPEKHADKKIKTGQKSADMCSGVHTGLESDMGDQHPRCGDTAEAFQLREKRTTAHKFISLSGLMGTIKP